MGNLPLGLTNRAGLAELAEQIRSRQMKPRGNLAGKPHFFGLNTGEISEREEDVVLLLCEGLTNKQIAQVLYISNETIKTHIQHVLRRCDLLNRTHLAAAYCRGELKVMRYDGGWREVRDGLTA